MKQEDTANGVPVRVSRFLLKLTAWRRNKMVGAAKTAIRCTRHEINSFCRATYALSNSCGWSGSILEIKKPPSGKQGGFVLMAGRDQKRDA